MNSKHAANVLIIFSLLALVVGLWWQWPAPPPPAKEPTMQVRPPRPRTPPPQGDMTDNNAPAEPEAPAVDPAVLQALAQALLEQQQMEEQRIDKAVTINLRLVVAGAEGYFRKNGVSSVAMATIVGTNSSQYVRSFQPIDGEEYSAVIIQGQAVTASGVSGARTVTYGP